jgi:uncharacterized protein YcsI (UPF0317 family)
MLALLERLMAQSRPPPPPPSDAAQRIRLEARAGDLSSPTTGLAPGHIQANLIVLPKSVATDFEMLCARNPVPCPLLGKSVKPGEMYGFAPDNLFTQSGSPNIIVDIRTDVPQYNIYQDGKLLESKSDILREWNSDSVAFLIGCSFSFEAALTNAGLPPRQIQQSCNVPMFKTDVKLNPAGVFTGATQVVSMRPYLPQNIERVRDITRPFVKTHGEPVAWGWDAMRELGIKDIQSPDFGDPVTFQTGEVPVFWVGNPMLSR